MIDFALDKQRREGREAREAIYEACVVRFRPIMMTTMSALMGTMPIALGWGAGTSARRVLGLADVGGLIVSQVLTLYLRPDPDSVDQPFEHILSEFEGFLLGTA
jgi:HAE1 family hydrophobic/amphiphilic exporter-1